MKILLYITVSFLIIVTETSAFDNVHTTFSPKPVTSFQLAAVYFVPDYGKQTYDFKPDVNICAKSGYTVSECENPNMYVPEDKGCSFNGDNFYNPNDCICKSEFSISACSDNKVLGNDKCNGKAKECICPDKYKFTTANCDKNRTLSGTSCENKYESCNCDTAYKYDSDSCKTKFGTNAVVSGQQCNDGKYNNCSCKPDTMTGWSTTKPSCPTNSEDLQSKDDGCNKTYYKCGNCTPDQPTAGWSETAAGCPFGTTGTTKTDGCNGTLYQCNPCPSGQINLTTCTWKKCWLPITKN